MILVRLVQFLGLLTGVAYLVYFAVRGYQRRRPHWTGQSWLRFGTVCAAGVVLFLIGLAMTVAVDRGIFLTTITSPDGRSLWALGTLAVLFAGASIVATALGWFAVGAPERQFPGVRAQ